MVLAPPIAGMVVNVLALPLGYRFLPRFGFMRSVFLGFGLGFIVMILLEILVMQNLPGDAATHGIRMAGNGQIVKQGNRYVLKNQTLLILAHVLRTTRIILLRRVSE